jgi:hypothetical protein
MNASPNRTSSMNIKTSFPRKRESCNETPVNCFKIPAYAGMTPKFAGMTPKFGGMTPKFAEMTSKPGTNGVRVKTFDMRQRRHPLMSIFYSCSRQPSSR